MGSALVEGILRNGLCAETDIRASDVMPGATEGLRARFPGIRVGTNAETVAGSQVVLLCVKPPDLIPTLEAVAGAGAGAENPLYVSIAAGVPLARIEGALSSGGRAVRVMPNTPALIGKGASAFALGSGCGPGDAEAVHALLSAVGYAVAVPEKLLDAVTGVSGSGPAYVYAIIEALADGGVLMGIPKAEALRLAAHTVAGAAEMVLQTGEHPAVLRDAVTSPGGTTIAALAKLEDKGLRSALIEAVRTATEKASELGQ